jgi:hypothetical protein
VRLGTFVRALNPLANEHNTIKIATLSDWYEKKLSLQRYLHTAVSKINISLDIWTSTNRILFFGVVGHFVCHGSCSISKSLLALRQIGGHSGEEQFKLLRTILDEYEISDKLGVIIGDNVGSNDTLCRTICKWYQDEHGKVWDPEEHRIRCLGHIINLIVQAFLFAGSSTQLPLEDLEISDGQEEGEEGQISVVRPS